MRSKIRLFEFVLFMSYACAAATPSSASYDVSTNVLTVNFSESVSTENVLLGRITITDGSNSYTLTGGTLPDSSYYTNSLAISLVYGTVIDQLEQTIFGSTQNIELWGNTTTQVDEIESFDLNNCSVIFESGAFLDANNAHSDSTTLSLTVTDGTDPTITNCSYSATHNTLQFVFSDPVQFDQIAEDRSVDGGPGDGSLDPQVGSNDPGEDRNDNGVLDSEPNMIPFKIGFTDDAGNSVNLEGIKSVVQTADDDTLEIILTINDAKRLETTLDLSALSLNMSEAAFRDTLYNPVSSSSISVTVAADSLPLVADSAAFDYAKNEFYIYFRDSENSEIDISPTPAPVWSKIQIYNSSSSFSLTTGSVTASNNYLKIKNLSFAVFAQIENLIQYDADGNIADSVFCSLDAYSVYDRSENGNIVAPKVPLSFYAGSSSSTYATPQPDKDDMGGFVYYDASDNLLSFTWDTKIGSFNGIDVPDDDEIGDNDFSDLDGIALYNHQSGETLSLESGRVWRSGSKKIIYVDLSEADEVTLESNVNKDTLYLLLDFYTFASTKDNGSPAITVDSVAFIQYVADTTGPIVTGAQYDFQSGTINMTLNEPVIKSEFSTGDLSFQSVDESSVFNGSTISSADSTASYVTDIIITLSASGTLSLDDMDNADKTTFNMTVGDNAFTGLDGAFSEIDTLNVDYGRNYWITSFEAFPSATAQQFCAISYIGTDCDIMVDISSPTISDTLLTLIGRAFENTVVFDSTVSQYDSIEVSIASTVRSFTGQEKDTDDNGKVIFVFTDIKDEYGLGRNDTKRSLFVHGYSTPNDTVSSSQFANGGEIIYIDTDPLDITSTNNDLNVLLQAMTHEYTKMCLQHNKPDEQPWILEAVAQLMQKKIFGDCVFFGESTAPSTSTGNQLTYLSTGVNKLKGRTDQHNVYIFFTYLQEKLTALDLENEPEWRIVNEICQTTKVGVQSVDTALVAIGASKHFADYFADYGMACYLDLSNTNNEYNGIYSFESLDLVAAPSGKSASTLKWDKENNDPAPFMFKNIPPWSYNWIIMQGYIVDIEKNIVYKSPDLSATDTLIFNGYDGIQFKVKKLALKSGFLDQMTTDFEIVDFTIDTTTAFGKLPVTTDSDFTFKELGADSLGQPDTSTGVQIVMLMVAKVDDAPAPPTSDFWVSNIISLPEFSDLYGFQNQGAPNHIDLFVASQRAVYDSVGNENAIVLYNTETDSGELTLGILNNAVTGFTSYHTSFELNSETDYTFIFNGKDASGNEFIPDSLTVSTIFYNTATRAVLRLGKSCVELEPEALNSNQFLASIQFPKKLVQDFPQELSIVSNIIAFGPQNKNIKRPATVNIYSKRLTSSCRVYQYYDGQWHNIGGTINQDIISANTTALGRFVVLAGDNHLPESDQLKLPGEFALFPNYPNPFNPSTTIGYSLPKESNVSISIFNILGQTVWSKKDFHVNPGVHHITWSGQNMAGRSLASGVYFVEMKAQNFITHRKILLMK